jgi:hypothetical protein
MFLGCAQSDLIDLTGNDAGTTSPPGSGGTGADTNNGPGSGGSGAATGTGGLSTSGQGGSITATGGAGNGTGGMTGGTSGSGLGGNTGGTGIGTGTGGTSTGRGGSAAAGQSGTGGGAGHGQSGTGGKVGGTGGSGGSGGAAATFTMVYTKILSVYCTGSGCHNPGTSGGLSFKTQASAYTSVSGRVVPGDGADSDFYSTVESGEMPKGKAKLSATNLALIEAWIDAGALND